MDHNSNVDINHAYQKVTKRANLLYDFVILYHNYIYSQHTYEAENCNMMEIHTLTYIDDNPVSPPPSFPNFGIKAKAPSPRPSKSSLRPGMWKSATPTTTKKPPASM